MITSTVHTEFFGDALRDFRLTSKMIAELERLCACGVGSLCKKLFAGEFTHSEIIQTIRLGLIGAGTDPQEAANLVNVYASEAPLARVYPLAVAILEAAYFGTDAKHEGPQYDDAH